MIVIHVSSALLHKALYLKLMVKSSEHQSLQRQSCKDDVCRENLPVLKEGLISLMIEVVYHTHHHLNSI